MLEHILVIEQHIGRYLKYYSKGNGNNEIVHHINQNKSDNRIENLQLMTDSEHKALHNKLRCSKKVKRLDTGEVFNSASEASRMISKHQSTISQAINNKRIADGTYWKYIN